MVSDQKDLEDFVKMARVLILVVMEDGLGPLILQRPKTQYFKFVL